MGYLRQGKDWVPHPPTVANMGCLKQGKDWVPHPPHSCKHGLSEEGEGLCSPSTLQLQTWVVWSRGRTGFPIVPTVANMGCLKQGKDWVPRIPHSCKHGLSGTGEGMCSPSTPQLQTWVVWSRGRTGFPIKPTFANMGYLEQWKDWFPIHPTVANMGCPEQGKDWVPHPPHSCKHGLSEEGEGLCSPSTLHLQTWVVWSRGRTGFPIVPTVANMGCLKQGKDWVPRIPHSCKHGLSGTGEGMCSPSTPQLQTWVVWSRGRTGFPIKPTFANMGCL